MYLNAVQSSPAFYGTIKVKTAEVLDRGKITGIINDLPIDTKDIKFVDSVRVNVNAFARELGLPNRKNSLGSFRESVENVCNRMSIVTLYNNMKYRIGVAKAEFLKAYESVLNTDSEVIL